MKNLRYHFVCTGGALFGLLTFAMILFILGGSSVNGTPPLYQLSPQQTMIGLVLLVVGIIGLMTTVIVLSYIFPKSKPVNEP
jgi:hypothetical protein